MIYPDYLKTYIQLPTDNQYRHATKNTFAMNSLTFQENIP
jgi:hypothetical protein